MAAWLFALFLSSMQTTTQSNRTVSISNMLWRVGNTSIPTYLCCMLTAFNTHTKQAWFLGGKQLISSSSSVEHANDDMNRIYTMDIESKSITLSSSVLPIATSTYSQSFVQHLDMLYFIDGTVKDDTLHALNLSSYSAPYSQTALTSLPSAITDTSCSWQSIGCLTMHEEKLYMTGGRRADLCGQSAETWVFSLQSRLWTQGASITRARSGHSCHIVDGVMYVIGGNAPVKPWTFDTIEKWHVLDSDATFGSISPVELSPGRANHRSVDIGNGRILIAGGIVGCDIYKKYYCETALQATSAMNLVTVLHTNGGQEFVEDLLPMNAYRAYHGVLQIYDHYIVVGGWNEWQLTRYDWEYTERVPTSEPTSFSPTISPTISPTKTQATTTTKTQTETPTKTPTESLASQSDDIRTYVLTACFVGLPMLVFFVLVVYFVRNKRRMRQQQRVNHVELTLLAKYSEEKPHVHEVQVCTERLRDALRAYVETPQKAVQTIDIQAVLQDFHDLLAQSGDRASVFSEHTCSLPNCIIFKRHFRDRFKSTSDDAEKNAYSVDECITLDASACAKMQILDKVHCFYQHSLRADDQDEEKHVQPVCHNQAVQDRLTRKFNQLTADDTFSFGYKFEYIVLDDGESKECKQPPAANENVKHVKQTYASFKEEMTQNEIEPLNMQMFDIEYKRAEIHFNSQYSKSKWTDKNYNVEHVLSVMIYCNFDTLQCKFSETYRGNYGLQHGEFYHFGRILKAAVISYGTAVQDGDTFFHGITRKLIPSEIVGDLGKGIRIYCPLSTSSSSQIAMKFARSEQGMIMTFGGPSEAKYFSTDWLSDYPHERERLFLQTEDDLQINNIIECSSGVEFGGVLQALKALDACLSQMHFHGRMDESLMEDVKHILCHQLALKKECKEFTRIADLHEYAQKILDAYFSKRNKKLSFHRDVLQRNYRAIANVLSCDSCNGIEISKIKALFPYITDQHITGKQCSCA